MHTSIPSRGSIDIESDSDSSETEAGSGTETEVDSDSNSSTQLNSSQDATKHPCTVRKNFLASAQTILNRQLTAHNYNQNQYLLLEETINAINLVIAGITRAQQDKKPPRSYHGFLRIHGLLGQLLLVTSDHITLLSSHLKSASHFLCRDLNCKDINAASYHKRLEEWDATYNDLAMCVSATVTALLGYQRILVDRLFKELGSLIQTHSSSITIYPVFIELRSSNINFPPLEISSIPRLRQAFKNFKASFQKYCRYRHKNLPQSFGIRAISGLTRKNSPIRSNPDLKEVKLDPGIPTKLKNPRMRQSYIIPHTLNSKLLALKWSLVALFPNKGRGALRHSNEPTQLEINATNAYFKKAETPKRWDISVFDNSKFLVESTKPLEENLVRIEQLMNRLMFLLN